MPTPLCNKPVAAYSHSLDWWWNNVLYLSIRPSVRSSACEHGTLKTDKSIFLQIGKNGPRGKGLKRSTLGARRSKIKVK